MYYKQSTKQVKLVILSFDDVMFDLTRLRYNYYRRLCKLYNVSLNKEDFFNNQGSCRTMFQNNPIDAALLNQENMISKIEKDLLTYCQMYGMKHKDGLVELMELFRQKKLQCIVTSTHPKAYTEPLFKLAALYHQPTEVVCDDDCQYVLPDSRYYQNILDKYQVSASEALVIASHKQAIMAANRLRMNVIAVPGLEDTDKEAEIRCLKVATSLLEVINIILEGRMAPLSDQYLLIRYDGGTQDLYQNYQHLRDVYRNDPTTLATIEKIYQEEFSRAQKNKVEEQIRLQEQKSEPSSQIDTTDISVLDTLEDALNSEEKEIITTITNALASKREEKMPIEEIVDEEENETDIELEAQAPAYENNPLDAMQEIDPSLTLSALTQEADTEETPLDTHLMDMIEEVTQTDIPPLKNDEITHTKIFTKEELKAFGIKEEDLLDGTEDFEEEDDEEDDDAPSLVISFIVNIGYAIMDAIILSVFGGILMVGLKDWISSPQSSFYFVHRLLVTIGDVSVMLFGKLTNSLTSFFNTSKMFDGFLAVILLMTIVIWIILDIISIIKRNRAKHTQQ